MPDDLVQRAERIKQKVLTRPVVAPSNPEQFLLDEGLDLLANYRSIVDQSVRLLVSDFVQAVAALQDAKCRDQPVALHLARKDD